MARYIGDKEVADFLIKEEGFLDKPTDIGDGKITLGSGLTDPKWHALYKKKGRWSKEDNRNAVLEEVAKRRVWAEDTIPNWEQLPESAQDALLSYKYNYNFTPTNSPNLFEAMRKGNFFKAAEEINATSKDPKFRKGLEERRKREQEMFLSDLMPQKTSNHSVYVPYSNNAVSDNTRVVRFPSREESSQFRTIVPERNYVETTTISPGEQRAQQLRNTFESTRDYNRMMQNISIQNNPQPTFTPQYNYHSEGGSLNSKTWDNLSMAEKSEMMRVAIENGITTLPEIKEAYNEFAKGGYAPSKAIKDRITAYEGKAMTGAKDPVTGKWGKNNSFESEATRFYNVLPENIREQVLSNPELADNLYSYSYNVGAGNFKKRVVPALERYYAGEGSIKDIENSMWASNDAKLRGLQRRRAEEKEGVRNALLGEAIPSLPVEQELPTFMPYNPQAFFAPLESYQRPVVVEEPLVQAAMENPYSPEQLEREERAQGLRNLGLAMSIMRGGQEQSYSPLWSAVSMLSGNQMAKGGKIHIKPENRGKFTALNAKKWKHGLGGNLFSGEDTPTQQMNSGLNLYRNTNKAGDVWYTYQETPDSEEILLTPTNKRFSDDPTNWDYIDASGREYSPRMTTTYNPGEIREDTRGPLERMVDNYFGELKYQANNNVPISGKYTMPAIAATPFLAWAGEAAYPYVSTALANPYVDAGIKSAFAGHGLNHTINEGIDGWGDAAITAMELAPLGRLARPIYNAGIDAAASGRRFILDVGDRYQGMKDAAAYRDANGIKDARAIANTKWLESYEKPAGINRMGVNNDGSFGIYYPDNSKAGHWYSPVIEKGGKMTLTTHLGGDIPGEYSKDLLPMSKSEIAATIKYLRGVPEHTYFGEVGKTKNYAEQYFNENPSRIRAFRDAIHGKKEINEPYWNEEEHITDFMNETDPIEQAYYRHMYEANAPLSIDSYKLILQEAAKNNGKFALRYDSSPMGMFNPQGVYEEEFYNSLQSLTPKEQVKSINDWMRSYYPKARPAYLKNGEVMIPRPLLMLKSSK